MFIMLRTAIKVFGKLLVLFLGTYFGFQNCNIHYVYDAKDCNIESYWSMFL